MHLDEAKGKRAAHSLNGSGGRAGGGERSHRADFHSNLAWQLTWPYSDESLKQLR